MLKIIYDLLVANNIVVREFTEENYWEETDAEIVIDDFYHIQIGRSYLLLWEQIPNTLYRIKYEVTLDKIDNSKKVAQFIKKVKSIYKPSASDIYDYSAE